MSVAALGRIKPWLRYWAELSTVHGQKLTAFAHSRERPSSQHEATCCCCSCCYCCFMCACAACCNVCLQELLAKAAAAGKARQGKHMVWNDRRHTWCQALWMALIMCTIEACLNHLRAPAHVSGCSPPRHSHHHCAWDSTCNTKWLSCRTLGWVTQGYVRACKAMAFDGKAASLPKDDAEKGALHQQPNEAQVPHSPVHQSACYDAQPQHVACVGTRGSQACKKTQSVPWQQAD